VAAKEKGTFEYELSLKGAAEVKMLPENALAA